jgi:hypothetical protein
MPIPTFSEYHYGRKAVQTPHGDAPHRDRSTQLPASGDARDTYAWRERHAASDKLTHNISANDLKSVIRIWRHLLAAAADERTPAMLRAEHQRHADEIAKHYGLNDL